VAERGADAAADEYNQKAHARSFVVPGMKKPPCGGAERTPTAGFAR
jgi:hypothetical protein